MAKKLRKLLALVLAVVLAFSLLGITAAAFSNGTVDVSVTLNGSTCTQNVSLTLQRSNNGSSGWSTLSTASTSSGSYTFGELDEGYYRVTATLGSLSVTSGNTRLKNSDRSGEVTCALICNHSGNTNTPVVVPATCETAGSSSYTCSVCGQAVNTPTAALGHNWLYTDNGDGDGAGGGTHDAVCQNDAAHVIDDEAHAWGAGVTSTSEGVRTTVFTCAKCGATYQTQVSVFNVSNDLTYVTTNNSATEAVEGSSYSATLSPQYSGFTINSVTVTMGGTDITATAYNSTTRAVSISNVTGHVVITAIASSGTTITGTADHIDVRTAGSYRMVIKDENGTIVDVKTISATVESVASCVVTWSSGSPLTQTYTGFTLPSSYEFRKLSISVRSIQTITSVVFTLTLRDSNGNPYPNVTISFDQNGVQAAARECDGYSNGKLSGLDFIVVDNQTVTQTSTVNDGSLRVTKVVTGHALPDNFYMQVYEDGSPYGSALTVANKTGGTGTAADPYYWDLAASKAGTYTVQEFNYDVAGYSCTPAIGGGVTFALVKNTAQSTSTHIVYDLKCGGSASASIAVTNNYTRGTGSLTITKTFGAGSAISPADLSFLVSGPGDYTATTYALSQFTLSGGVYTLTLTGLPTGDYTVKELSPGRTGYSLAVTGNGSTLTADGSGDYALTGTVSSQAPTLAFVNTYTSLSVDYYYDVDYHYAITIDGVNYNGTIEAATYSTLSSSSGAPSHTLTAGERPATMVFNVNSANYTANLDPASTTGGTVSSTNSASPTTFTVNYTLTVWNDYTYKVVGAYYTDGVLDGSTDLATGLTYKLNAIPAAGTVGAAYDDFNTYTLDSYIYGYTSCTPSGSNNSLVYTLRFDRTTSDSFQGSITVKKVDAANSATTLSGAVFTLYSGSTPVGTYTTGSAGTVEIPFTAEGTYYLAETAAPANYTASATQWKITVSKTDGDGHFGAKISESQTGTVINRIWSWIIGLVKQSGSDTDWSFERGVLTVENAKTPYTLTVNYYVKDSDPLEVIKTAYTDTVYSGDSYNIESFGSPAADLVDDSLTYGSLGTYVYSNTDGSAWSGTVGGDLTINLYYEPEGDGQVTINYFIDDGDYDAVNHTGNRVPGYAQETHQGNDGVGYDFSDREVAIPDYTYSTTEGSYTGTYVKDGVIYIDILYIRDTGDLTITKAFGEGSDLTPDDLSFQVTGPDGYDETFALSDFTLDGDVYYLYLTVPTGTYTVTEQSPGRAGYTLVVLGNGEELTPVGGDYSLTVEVTKALPALQAVGAPEAAIAAFVNTYTEIPTAATCTIYHHYYHTTDGDAGTRALDGVTFESIPVTAGDHITVSGYYELSYGGHTYTVDTTRGDAGAVVIIVAGPNRIDIYYLRDETIIPSPTPPTTEPPEETDIPSPTPPLASPKPTSDDSVTITDGAVPQAPAPKTGDATDTTLLWVLMILSASGLATLGVTGLRDKHRKKHHN